MLTPIKSYEINNIRSSLWYREIDVINAEYILDNMCFQNSIYLGVFGKWDIIIHSVEKHIWENYAN